MAKSKNEMDDLLVIPFEHLWQSFWNHDETKNNTRYFADSRDKFNRLINNNGNNLLEKIIKKPNLCEYWT